jgi:hypothetical protein
VAKVFVSSTLEDLQEHRAAVRAALMQHGHAVVMLDEMHASPRTPLQQIRASIATCDAIVTLLAWRYGYVPPDDNPDQLSYVELEFRYARELKKATFVFIVKNDFQWSPQFIDSDDQAQRLRAFRAEVMRRGTVDFFTTPEDLTKRVVEAVSRWEQESRGEPAIEPDQAPIPATVDPYELAWRLVVAIKAEPALLRHMDSNALRRATEQWASEARSGTPLNRPKLYEVAQEQLRASQANLAPNPLWLAWMRATGLGRNAPPPNDVSPDSSRNGI